MYTITYDGADGGTATIELHDVEKLVFFDEDGEITEKLLTDGSVESIAADYDSVSFKFDGDDLSVVQEAEVWVVDVPQQVIYVKGNKTSPTPKKGYKEQITPEQGHYEMQSNVLWEGSKDDVMAFEFADGVTVNVIKSIDEPYFSLQYSKFSNDNISPVKSFPFSIVTFGLFFKNASVFFQAGIFESFLSSNIVIPI